MIFPSLIPCAGTDGDDVDLLGLLLGRVRDDNPAGGLLLHIYMGNHNPIRQTV